MRKTLGILLVFVFLSGCASRYKTYTLIEGSEERNNTFSKSSSDASDPNSSSMTEQQDQNDEQLVKRVIVDRKTGNIYYFQSIGGTLQVKEPKK